MYSPSGSHWQIAHHIYTQGTQYDSILGGQSSVVFDPDLGLEMPLDISPLYAPEAEVPDLWTEPWLGLPSSGYN